MIFQEVLKIKKKIDIFLDEIDEKEKIDKLRESIIRRSKREPLQHIIGYVEFDNCTIKSDHRALIPRFETESLVELIVERLPTDFNKRIFDFGTGSGAIMIALKQKVHTSSKCIGFDKSEEALSLAKENVMINHCTNNTEIRLFDWKKETISEKCNVLVSNPPYLSIEEWEKPKLRLKSMTPKLLISDNGVKQI